MGVSCVFIDPFHYFMKLGSFLLILFILQTSCSLPILNSAMLPVYNGLIRVEELSPSTTDNLGFHDNLHTAEHYQEAMRLGAKIINLPEHYHNTYFVYWLPQGYELQSERRVMVMLHGTGGDAYQRISVMHEVATEYRFAIVSIQWGLPNATFDGLEYLPISEVYEMIHVAMDYMNYHFDVDRAHSVWNGFSRSSTHCALYAYMDEQGENPIFNYFIAVSGEVGEDLPGMENLFEERDSGGFPLEDVPFYLWGGEGDPGEDPTDGKTRADQMAEGEILLESFGADVFLRISESGHGGFYHNLDYEREAVQFWMQQDYSAIPPSLWLPIK